MINNDLAGYGSGSKVAAKATSATSARYSTTATNAGTSNYAKNGAKASSATSATYSSTANYAKNCSGLSFGQDEEGNWGYKPSGADTVIPFRSGSGSSGDTEQLYEALQYSGLVTEDMSYDEMCAALAEAYPNSIILINNKSLSTAYNSVKTKQIGSGYADLSAILTSGQGLVITSGIHSEGYNSGYNIIYFEKSINVTTFNKLQFTITNDTFTNNEYHDRILNIGISTSTENTVFDKYTTINYQASGVYEIDISSCIGNMYFKFVHTQYGWGTNMTISDIRFII